MVRVAVAGGTGGLGRTVTEAIARCKKHDVFVLSRTRSDVFASEPAVTVLDIDYSSPDAIAAALKNNSIDTVISCLSLTDNETNQAQLNLIEGAAKSTTVRRFTPSEFGIDYMEAQKQKYDFPFVEFKVAAVEKLRAAPSLTYTRFVTGTFMDYFGPAEASYLRLITLIVDVENEKAAIPGDGNISVALTHSRDVAKLVSEAISLEEWPEAYFFAGEKITLNELVSIAESVKGRKFDVVYDTIDDLKAGKNTELPANISRYQYVPKAMIDNISQNVGLAIANGWLNFPSEAQLKLPPSIKPMSVKELLEGNY